MIRKISLNTINNYNHQKRAVFGSMEREVFKDKEKNVVQYRNTTLLLRPDLNWDILIKHITKDKTPKKIYCYACSDGSEAYSIAMHLIAKLGWKKAQKYFPIIAKDIDDYALKKAKCGYIDLSVTDVLGLNEIQDSSKIKFMYVTKPAMRYDEYSVFRVDEKLKKCIEFSRGDLCDDARFLNYDNSVIFFRNVWPYLSKDRINYLLKVFSQNFKNSTSLVIGGYDVDNPEFDRILDNSFKDLLFLNNLWQVKPMIYKAHNLKNHDIVNPGKILKILANFASEKYYYVIELLRNCISG